MHYFVTILMTLITFTPMGLFALGQQGPTIQILLEKDSRGMTTPMLINGKGEKIRLTLGTFINATAESWMDGKAQPTPKEKLDPRAIAFVRLDKEDHGLKAYIFDNKGREEPLNLGNFLSAAAESYPSCVAKKENDQTVDLKILFAQDFQNHLQAYINTPRGKEEFNLGVLLKEVVLLLNKCE